MKYFETIFTISPCSQVAQDILSATAAEAGYETFEETETGVKGYVQQTLYDPQTLDSILADFPLEGVTITYATTEAEDKDWNEQWEQEGFEPIVIDNRLVIHDGRHPLLFGTHPTPLTIEIDARLAFGTGTHETTRMICAALLDIDLHGKRVLDCGCGTGILDITALRLGADLCVAYDIDEWSVDNTRHNAVINCVDDRLTQLHGDATILDTVEGTFDVVMANINRNILLQDMERFASKMHTGSLLLLSGFYLSDAKLLEDHAKTLGLTLLKTNSDHEWTMMELRK